MILFAELVTLGIIALTVYWALRTKEQEQEFVKRRIKYLAQSRG